MYDVTAKEASKGVVMEEVVLRWIERVGFPIFIACVSLYAVYRLFRMFLDKSDILHASLVEHSKIVQTLSENSNHAVGANTLATQELTDTLKKKLGSDPNGLCQAVVALKEAGFECKASDVVRILQAREEREAKEAEKAN